MPRRLCELFPNRRVPYHSMFMPINRRLSETRCFSVIKDGCWRRRAVRTPVLQEAVLMVAADTLNQHTSSWARHACILRYRLAGHGSASVASLSLVTRYQWVQQITPGDRSLVISFSIARFTTAVLEIDEGSSNRESLSVISCTTMSGRKKTAHNGRTKPLAKIFRRSLQWWCS